MQAMKGGQDVRHGMGMGHPQSDAGHSTAQQTLRNLLLSDQIQTTGAANSSVAGHC